MSACGAPGRASGPTPTRGGTACTVSPTDSPWGKPDDCCSGHCSSATRTCCLPNGAKTQNRAKCCSGMRKKSTGRCTCKAEGATCDAATAHKCCSGRCDGGECGPPCQAAADCPARECHDPVCVGSTGTCEFATEQGTPGCCPYPRYCAK